MRNIKRILHIFLVVSFLLCVDGVKIAKADSKISEDEEKYFKLGNDYKKQMLYDKAIIEYKKAIEIKWDYTEAHREYQDIMKKQGKKDIVLKEYESSLEDKPNSEVHHYLYGRLLDNPDKQMVEFKRSIQLNPNYFWGHIGLGFAYASKGLYDEAIEEYKQAIKFQPDYVIAHNNLGNAYASKGLYDESIEEYKQAIKFQPDFVEAHNNLGISYYWKGLYDKEIEKYKQAIEIQPDFVEAHNNLGIAYASKGLYDEAIEEYKQAIKFQPDFVEAHNNLGIAYASKGLYDEAIEEYKQAIEIQPGIVEAYEDLQSLGAKKIQKGYDLLSDSKLIEAQKEFKDAESIYAFFLKKKGKDNIITAAKEGMSEALALQGEISRKLGDIVRAKKVYRKSLEMNPKNPIALKGLHDIERKPEPRR